MPETSSEIAPASPSCRALESESETSKGRANPSLRACDDHEKQFSDLSEIDESPETYASTSGLALLLEVPVFVPLVLPRSPSSLAPTRSLLPLVCVFLPRAPVRG